MTLDTFEHSEPQRPPAKTIPHTNLVKIWSWARVNWPVLLAFLGLLVARFVNLNPYLGQFPVNNLLDILLAPAHCVVAILVVREFWFKSGFYRMLASGLLSLGMLQIYGYNPSFTELFRNLVSTLILLLWISVLARLLASSTITNTQKFGLIAILFLYSWLDHLLLTNPIPVLLVWTTVQLAGRSEQFWLWPLLIFLALNAVAAGWQVLSGYSLGLHLLGEPYLSPLFAGLARQPIGDFRLLLLRGYGLMQHPNVLGFVGAIGVWFGLRQAELPGFIRKLPFKLGTQSTRSRAAGQFYPTNETTKTTITKNRKNHPTTKDCPKISRLHYKWEILLLLSLLLAMLSFSRIAWLGTTMLLMIRLFENTHGVQNRDVSKIWSFLLQLVGQYWWAWLVGTTVFGYIFLSRFAYAHGTDAVRLQEYRDYFSAYQQLTWTQRFFGVGLGSYAFYLRTFNPDWSWWEWQPIHNIWLSTVFELGLVWSSLLALLLFRILSQKQIGIPNQAPLTSADASHHENTSETLSRPSSILPSS